MNKKKQPSSKCIYGAVACVIHELRQCTTYHAADQKKRILKVYECQECTSNKNGVRDMVPKDGDGYVVTFENPNGQMLKFYRASGKPSEKSIAEYMAKLEPVIFIT